MIKLDGKIVHSCGWAGPLLWIYTTDNYSIHFYDAPVFLNRTRVKAPHDVNLKLAGQRINGFEADKNNFSVRFDSGKVLKVGRAEVETARVFKTGARPHWVYESGAMRRSDA